MLLSKSFQMINIKYFLCSFEIELYRSMLMSMSRSCFSVMMCDSSPGKILSNCRKFAEGCVGAVAEDPVRVRADEVGLLGVEVGRLDELGREKVLEVPQQAPVLHEPVVQSKVK